MLNRSPNVAKTWVVVFVGALVLALAAFLVLSTSPDSTFAQAPDNMIMYAENGMEPVRTFTSEDPEGAGINWDVTGIDADDFEISGGVLTFKNPPNYEKPTDRLYAKDMNGDGDTGDEGEIIDAADNNMYQITIRASEMRASGYMGRALSTETHVTVQVTDVNEDGMVTIDLRQPEVGTPIMASVTDPDGTNGVTWQWSVSTVTNPVPTANNHWANATVNGSTGATYTPTGDEDKYLRAVASYTDSLGVARTAIGVSEFPVRAEVTTDNDDDSNPENGSPGFTQGANYTRTVSESLGKGMNVGDPVAATDPNGDTLTHELDNDMSRDTQVDMNGDVGYFSIDKTSGQLMVKKTLDWDMNGTPPDGKYMFYVRAIDPSGETAEVEVTVTATDANDAPKIMGSSTSGNSPAAPSEIRVLEQDSDDRDGNGQPDATYHGTPDGMMGEAGSAMGLPVALDLGNQNVFTAPDEDARGQITWTLDGVDKDDFVLSQTNLSGSDEPVAIVFKDLPDYENPTDADGDSVYKVVLEARDSGGLTDTRPITIFVDNVAEQGKATLMATGNGIDQPTIDSTITADVVDPDGGVAVLTWQWLRSKSDAGSFKIIDRATAPDYTPIGGDDGYYLRAIATYIDTTSEMDDPDTGAIDERVQESATAAYTATRGDGVEPAPGDKVFRVSVTSEFAVRFVPGVTPGKIDLAFPMESYELELVENAEVGSIVDAGDDPIRVGVSATYDLDATETNDDDYFTIDAYGQIRVKEIDFRLGRAGTIYPMEDPDLNMGNPGYPYGDNAPAMEDPILDFEGTKVFRLVVTATDSNDPKRKARTNVTIRLTDLNEMPYFDKASRDEVAGTINYAEARVNRVVPLAATEPDEPDGGDLRWEVEGTDAADFEIIDAEDIPGDGKDRRELYFKSQPNYEKPTARGKNANATRDEKNQYSVIVRAIEAAAIGGGPNLAAELPVTVQVTNSNEPGEVEVKWLQPEVNTPLPAILTDPDGNSGAALPIVIADGHTTISAGNITDWQWYRAKNSDPDLDPNIGTLGLGASDWEPISGATSTPYTPQGKTAMAGGAPAMGTEVDKGWKLLVKADYTDGEGATKSAIGITYMPVRADVHDDQNNSPDFRQDETARSVPEDTAVGMVVGDLVDVDTDEDNDTLTYTLDNDKDPATPLDAPTGPDIVGGAVMGNRGDVAYFSIDKDTGQIRVAKPLDWDDKPSASDDPDGKYILWVRATDPSGEIDDEDNDYIKVTITASDINEAPKVKDGRAEISIDEVDSSKKPSDGSAYYIGLGNAADGLGGVTQSANNDNLYRRDDADRVDSGRWPDGPIPGPDGDLFQYSTPVGEEGIARRLHFKKTNLPDYENPMDHNRDNVYEVTVIVRDNRGETGMKNVRITVMNVNEEGKLVLSPDQPDDGMPVTATLFDPDGVEIITDWKWAETSSRGGTDFPGSGVKVYSTTDEHRGSVGSFVWAMVDYRDGASMDDDPVTALDERNNDPDSDDDPGTTGADEDVEHHKFQDPADNTNMLFHNSDRMMSEKTENAVRRDPAGSDDLETPSLDVVERKRRVYENVPSTGYVDMPLLPVDLNYPDGKGETETRNTIGGPDGESFVFAEMYDNNMIQGYYDSTLAPTPDNMTDKFGQLAAAVVTHFDYEADKNEYIIEVTDPDAEVSVGPVRVTITVMNVNEAPSAPSELKGGIAISGSSAENYDEVTDAAATTWDTVAMYRAQGGETASAVWTLSGADAADFTITANVANGMDDTTGANASLTFNAAPDYEMPADADMDSVYEVTLTASDGTNSVSRDVTVTVANVNEGGRVTLWVGTDALTTPSVGQEITARVEDSDGNPGDSFPIAMYTVITSGNVTGWQWARADAADGAFTDINGATDAAYTPATPDDDGKFLRATAMYADMEGAGKMAMVMTMAVGSTPSTGSALGDRYDSVANGGNGDGQLDTLEMLKAVREYFAEESTITVSQMLELVRIYFGS